MKKIILVALMIGSLNAEFTPFCLESIAKAEFSRNMAVSEAPIHKIKYLEESSMHLLIVGVSCPKEMKLVVQIARDELNKRINLLEKIK